MNLGYAIFYLLNNSEPVTVLVGVNGIYPNRLPQEVTGPGVVYAIEDTEPTDTKDGVSILDIKRFSLWAMADDYDACRDLAEKCRTALDRKSGLFGGVDVDSIRFDSADDDQYDDDLKKHFCELRFKARVRR